MLVITNGNILASASLPSVCSAYSIFLLQLSMHHVAIAHCTTHPPPQTSVEVKTRPDSPRFAMPMMWTQPVASEHHLTPLTPSRSFALFSATIHASARFVWAVSWGARGAGSTLNCPGPMGGLGDAGGVLWLGCN